MRIRTGAILSMLKTLIVWYLAIYLPVGFLCHAKAYVNFVHHRASGIPYEIMSIYDAHPASAITLHWAWFWPPWKLQGGCLRNVYSKPVPIGDRHQASVSVGTVIWGDSVENKKATARMWLGNHFIEGLTWIEGQPVSGKPKLTLVAFEASERLGNIAERWNPSQQRIVLYAATITRAINHVYNANNVWYFFTATTSIDVSLLDNPELAAIAEEAIRQPGSFVAFPLGTLPQALAPEDDPQITAALNELVTKAGRWRAGMQSTSLLFQSIRAIDLRYAGLVTLHDSFVPNVLWSIFLYLPTLPIRYLLFFPLIIVPHWLVIPLAFLYLPALLLLLGQCIRRFIRQERRLTLMVLIGVHLFIISFCSSP